MVPAFLLDLMPRVLQNTIAYKPLLLSFVAYRDGEFIEVKRTQGQANAVNAVKKMVPAFLLHLMPRVLQDVFAYDEPFRRRPIVFPVNTVSIRPIIIDPDGSSRSKKVLQRG